MPRSYSSSRLMQRRSVVLPEPLGPMTTTTSPGCTDSDTLRNTVCSPNRLVTPAISSIGRRRVSGASMAKDCASLKVSSIEGQSIADAEIDRRGADEDLERRERAFDDLAARHRQLPQADDRDQRGRLNQADAEADKRRRGET